MSMIQLQLDCDQQPLPFQDEIWPGESGQGYVLRLAARNGMGGLGHVKAMIGCSRLQTLYSQDAPKLAQWFGASVRRLSYALEATNSLRRVDGSTYMGHKLSRSYFLNRSRPRVCPECIYELGYCRAAWDFTLTVACVRHQRLLINRCPACTLPLKWTRPELCLCYCGYPWAELSSRSPATNGELFVAQFIDLKMDDQERFATGDSAWSLAQEDEINALRLFMKDLSLDGFFRSLFALATAAGYEADAPHERRLRAAMPRALQTIAMSIAVGVKLTQQRRFSLTSSPYELHDLLRELRADFPTTPIDVSVAQSLFRVLQSNKPARLSKQVLQPQLVLF